jgi:hypothetical protein
MNIEILSLAEIFMFHFHDFYLGINLGIGLKQFRVWKPQINPAFFAFCCYCTVRAVPELKHGGSRTSDQLLVLSPAI